MADGECSWYDVPCKLGSAASDAVSSGVADMVKGWAQSVLEGVDATLSELGTFWVDVPTPGLSGSGASVGWVQSAVNPLTLGLAVGSMMVAGITLMITHRGESVRKIVRGMVLLVLVSGSAIAVTQTVVDIGDEFSTWIIEQANEGGGSFAAKLLTLETMTGSFAMIIMIVLGLAALVANIVQIGLMFVRSAMLLLAVGIMPMAAAASFTDWGVEWLKRLIGWTAAFVAMKPTAAIIYALAIRLVSGNSWNIAEDDELMKFILGSIMIILAAFALPALVSFLVPVAAVMGSGGAAGAVVGGAAATGAMSVARMSGGGGGGAAAASGADSAPTGSSPAVTGGGSGSSGGAVALPAPGGGQAPSAGGGAAGAGAGGGAAGAGAGAGGGAAAASGGAASAGAAAATGGASLAVTGAIQAAKTATSAVQGAASEAAGATGSGEVQR
ncbi:hypothetical protein [Actinomyces faecalis]|uniref:hypothetical protein n=1 Tax=Actinomyces faecalis TaxID=2722820 RepID=UPI00155668B5|nr:hypothetical protein [Actinomyces faecalis]